MTKGLWLAHTVMALWLAEQLPPHLTTPPLCLTTQEVLRGQRNQLPSNFKRPVYTSEQRTGSQPKHNAVETAAVQQLPILKSNSRESHCSIKSIMDYGDNK